jgi:hypothetical protein
MNDKDEMIMWLQKELAEERSTRERLEKEVKLRVSSFLKKQNAVDQEAARLAEEEDASSYLSLSGLKIVHTKIESMISEIQEKHAESLVHQESSLLQQFRAKFEEVAFQLEQLKTRRGDFNQELQGRLRQTLDELKEAQELNQILESKNQTLESELAEVKRDLDEKNQERVGLLRDLLRKKIELENLKKPSNQETKKSSSASVKLTKVPTKDEQAAEVAAEPRPAASSNPEFSIIQSLRSKLTDLERHLASEKTERLKLTAALSEHQAEDSEIRRFISTLVSQQKRSKKPIDEKLVEKLMALM